MEIYEKYLTEAGKDDSYLDKGEYKIYMKRLEEIERSTEALYKSMKKRKINERFGTSWINSLKSILNYVQELQFDLSHQDKR